MVIDDLDLLPHHLQHSISGLTKVRFGVQGHHFTQQRDLFLLAGGFVTVEHKGVQHETLALIHC